MSEARQELGRTGEALAREFLLKKGFSILCQNYRTRLGEIDLIVMDKDTLVFVEVRTKRNTLFGNPLETVNHRKQSKIVRLARLFLVEHPETARVPCRFDVIGIVCDQMDPPEIIHIENAFSA